MYRTLQHYIHNIILEEIERNKISKIVSNVINEKLNENSDGGKSGKRKTATTKERQDRKFYNDPLTNGAEVARRSLPKDWKDSTKRSYISKLFSNDNKNPRKPDQKIIDKVHDAST